MDRATELALIDELLTLRSSGSLFLDDAVAHNAVQRYRCPQQFEGERAHIFRKMPNAAAHSSELSGEGAFLRREVAGLPVLLTRDKAGQCHAFLNVCRHRGTRLVDEAAGCRHRFTCPYHAWTYSSSGELLAAPHFDAGFPGMDKSSLGLHRLPCEERFGLVWVVADNTADPAVDVLTNFFAGLETDLAGLELDRAVVAVQHSDVRHANWKILVEGGIEAYHFKIAHRKTIGPYFEDNLSSYQCIGPHIRSVLPRSSLQTLRDHGRDTWRLRDHANVLYSIFPTTQFLVQQDHVVWLRQEPLAADQTRIWMSTLVPADRAEESAHWARNHQITQTTLDEDFVIGESIQQSLDAGANSSMLFGRFEGALARFNQTVQARLDSPG